MVDLGKAKAEKKEEKEKAVNADDPKAGADVGKMVTLTAGDANRVSNSLFLRPDIGSQNRITRSHKPYQHFISSTEVTLLPPHTPQFLLTDTQPMQHYSRS